MLRCDRACVSALAAAVRGVAGAIGIQDQSATRGGNTGEGGGVLNNAGGLPDDIHLVLVGATIHTTSYYWVFWSKHTGAPAVFLLPCIDPMTWLADSLIVLSGTCCIYLSRPATAEAATPAKIWQQTSCAVCDADVRARGATVT